jgi:hypothetical protein
LEVTFGPFDFLAASAAVNMAAATTSAMKRTFLVFMIRVRVCVCERESSRRYRVCLKV